jgi:hypothetical protein
MEREMKRLPLTVEYSKLSDEAKRGVEILERNLNDPQVQLATRALALWSDSLTTTDRHWLQHTAEGRREMWRRMGLAHQLCAALPPND